MKVKIRYIIVLLTCLVIVLGVIVLLPRKEIVVYVEQDSTLHNETKFYTDLVENQEFDITTSDLENIGTYKYKLEDNYLLVVHVVEPVSIHFLSSAVYKDGYEYSADIKVEHGVDVRTTYTNHGADVIVCVSATSELAKIKSQECKELPVIDLVGEDMIYNEVYNYSSYTDEAALIEDYLRHKEVDKNNVSIYYKNTVSDVEYSLNTQTERYGASTQKLLIAQYYYMLMEDEPEKVPAALMFSFDAFAGDGFGVESEYYVGDYIPLDILLNSMIKISDNTATNILLANIDYTIFEDQMKMYGELFTMDSFFQNLVSVDLLHEVLIEIYDHPSRYSQLWIDLGNASKEFHFAKELENVGVYHKYGAYEDSINDAGLIQAPEPFVLIVLSDSNSLSDEDLGELARILYEYQL